jgi:hypothetical protein
MAKHTKFQSGMSGCPEKQFKPGNPHRWPPGQSGNPSGIPRSRLKFEQAFYTALIEQGAPIEAALLLWECARAREPWAVQALLQRLAPETQRIKLTHEVENEQTIDYTRLTDAEIEQLESLLSRATTPVAETEGGESAAQLEAVCDPGVGPAGTGEGTR